MERPRVMTAQRAVMHKNNCDATMDAYYASFGSHVVPEVQHGGCTLHGDPSRSEDDLLCRGGQEEKKPA